MRYLEIRQEIDSNPGLYGAMTDLEVAEEFNVINKTQNKTSMTGNEILSNIEPSALAALTGDSAVKVMGIIGMEEVDPFGPAAQIFIDAFGTGTQTIINLSASRVETVSRASQLKLGRVREGDVTNARAI